MFYRSGQYIYIATDFCIVKFDPIKNEVKDTYYPTNSLDPIVDVLVISDTLYALSPSMLQRLMCQTGLSDPGYWTTDSRLTQLISTNQSYSDMEEVNGVSMCYLI